MTGGDGLSCYTHSGALRMETLIMLLWIVRVELYSRQSVYSILASPEIPLFHASKDGSHLYRTIGFGTRQPKPGLTNQFSVIYGWKVIEKGQHRGAAVRGSTS